MAVSTKMKASTRSEAQSIEAQSQKSPWASGIARGAWAIGLPTNLCAGGVVTPQVFAPEAQRILAGGGAKRNHRKRRNRSPRPGRAPDQDWLLLGAPVRRPCRDAKSVMSKSGGYALLHHRLISGVPPGRKCIAWLVRKQMAYAPCTVPRRRRSLVKWELKKSLEPRPAKV